MPQDEFIGMLKMADAFGLVKIDKDFMGGVKEKLTSHGLFTEEDIKKLGEVAKEEFSKAKAAGLDKIFSGFQKNEKPKETEKVEMPEKEVVTGSVSGIDIIDLEDAVESLWKAGIYAESGMGCTGPMVMVSEKKLEKALAVLADAGYVSRESLTC